MNSDVRSGRFDAEVDEDAAAINRRQNSFKVDQASTGIVEHASFTVALYKALRKRDLDAQEAVAALVAAMSKWVLENAEAYSFARLGVSRADPGGAFKSIRENFKKRGEERFGSHFVYEQEISDEKRSFVNITRCLYNDLLRSMGYPEVIPVFCAMDTIWAADVTHPRYGVQFDRPTTLAMNADKCRFQFSKAGTSAK
ncbi:L-2-amino-thiazoline-4-carboxylic acid hydrolase [Microvirga rosea]|uniref:L-2-amino-thiazoline-4-carboxylic acid hydrolase n=1 Tax=Microvirga rosea TaxID=2715425 RepID=UPI001D0AB782|nr:L-2-amino-thiazoline-4-carboxylic acid hydrolase [Microvirga rosea]MCB8823200.1 L-2-amino-thiazoline-4-carboxylic acid hydrolase [Microvirga rosea]